MKNNKKITVLSIIIPVFNEHKTVSQLLSKVQSVKLKGISKQLIVVDDRSTDGTREILKKLSKKKPGFTLILKEKNEGKGSAIRAAIPHITGSYTVIQDADLEYDPAEYPLLLKPILSGHADVVYGSRFLGAHRSFLFLNYVANKILNFVTNILYNSTMTDMESCYKMFRSEILTSLKLRSKGFEIEPEITAKILKKKCKVYEVPISFYGRGYEEGKKIKAIDGVKALWCLLKYRITD